MLFVPGSDQRKLEKIPTLATGAFILDLEDAVSTSAKTTVRVTLKVRGDKIEADFAGTSAQPRGPLNSTMGYTSSAVFMTIQAATDPTIDPNDGCYRPVRIVAPLGTIVNPHFPAACTGGNELTHIIHMATFRALAQIPRTEGACPRIIACDQGSSNNLFIAGHTPDGARYVDYEYPAGGWGGADGKDGLSAVWSIVGNTTTIPTEVLEKRFPIRLQRYELRTDSRGAGEFRGGLSVCRHYEILGPEAELSILANRCKVAPWGLFGGHQGALAEYVINPGRADERLAAPRFLSKGSMIALRQGDVVCQCTAGGGGYGDPGMRAVARVAEDVRLGYVSREAAIRDYGEVVADDLAVDEEATQRIRAGNVDGATSTTSALSYEEGCR